MKRFFAAAAAVCLTLLLPLTAAADSAVITAIRFTNTAAVAEENLSVSGYGDKDSGYAPSTIGGRLYASVSGTDLRKLEWSKGEYAGVGMQPVMTGGTKNPWGAGAYLELRTSSVGYEALTFSAQLGATNKGPRDYKLQYSTNGVSFKDVPGALFTVPANKTMFDAFDGVALPADAADRETLYIRITVTSNMMVNGTAGLIGSTGGETAINNIALCGVPLAVADTTTASAETDATTVGGNTEGSADTVTTTTVPRESGEAVTNVETGHDPFPLLLALTALSVTVAVITLSYRARKRL